MLEASWRAGFRHFGIWRYQGGSYDRFQSSCRLEILVSGLIRDAPTLVPPRVVLGVDISDIERTHTVDLHDGFTIGPGIVRHARRKMDEAPRRQRLERSAVHLFAGRNREPSRNHRDEFVLRMAMRRYNEARR